VNLEAETNPRCAGANAQIHSNDCWRNIPITLSDTCDSIFSLRLAFASCDFSMHASASRASIDGSRIADMKVAGQELLLSCREVHGSIRAQNLDSDGSGDARAGEGSRSENLHTKLHRTWKMHSTGLHGVPGQLSSKSDDIESDDPLEVP
jgi:hypothetical protein